MLYPVITESRNVLDLNGIWDFKLDNGNGLNEEWYKAKLENTMTKIGRASCRERVCLYV